MPASPLTLSLPTIEIPGEDVTAHMDRSGLVSPTDARGLRRLSRGGDPSPPDGLERQIIIVDVPHASFARAAHDGGQRRVSIGGTLEMSVFDDEHATAHGSPASDHHGPISLPKRSLDAARRRGSTATAVSNSSREGKTVRAVPADDSKLHFAALDRGDSYLLPEDMGRVRIGCSWDHVTKRLVDVDASAVLFAADGRKVDHVSFGRKSSTDRAVVHMGDERGHDRAGDDEAIRVALNDVSEQVVFITVVLNVYTTGRSLDDVDNVRIRLMDVEPSKRYVPPATSPSDPASGIATASMGSPVGVGASSLSAAQITPRGRSRSGSTVRTSPRHSAMNMQRGPAPATAAPASPTAPGRQQLPSTQGHVFAEYKLMQNRPRITGVVMLLFERLKATESGQALRERVQRFMAQVQQLKSESSAMRERYTQQNPDAARDETTFATSGHNAYKGLDEDSTTLPGWRVTAAGLPVAGKTHRHVTQEAAEIVNQLANARDQCGLLPAADSCEVYGFRQRLLLTADDESEMMRRRRDEQRGGDGPDLRAIGSLLDDAAFVEQFSLEMRRQRRAARGKRKPGDGDPAEVNTRTPTPEGEHLLDQQFRYLRGQRNLRPRMIRQARRIYSVGRAARPLASQQYYLESDSSDEGGFVEDLFPNFRSKLPVRYAPECYNTGCHRDKLYRHYQAHKASYAATARAVIAKAAEAEEEAWRGVPDAADVFDDGFSSEGGSGAELSSGEDLGPGALDDVEHGPGAATLSPTDMRRKPPPLIPSPPTYQSVRGAIQIPAHNAEQQGHAPTGQSTRRQTVDRARARVSRGASRPALTPLDDTHRQRDDLRQPRSTL
jgi:hypothetical protein